MKARKSVITENSESFEKLLYRLSKNFVETIIIHFPTWIALLPKQLTLSMMKRPSAYGTKYSKMDQVKFVEDSL